MIQARPVRPRGGARLRRECEPAVRRQGVPRRLTLSPNPDPNPNPNPIPNPIPNPNPNDVKDSALKLKCEIAYVKA